MSKQLTKEIRAEIVARVIRETFAQRESELKKAITAFADRAYEKLIPEQFLAVAGSLPVEYFLQTSTINLERVWKREKSDQIVTMDNPADSLTPESQRINKHNGDFTMSGKRPFPNSLVDNWNYRGKFRLEDSAAAKSLIKEHEGLATVALTIASEKKSMGERLNALLGSIRTIKALLDVAPEMKPFIPADAMEVRAPMPAPVVGTLITDLMKAGLKLQTVEA